MRKRLPHGVWNVTSQNLKDRFTLIAECLYPTDRISATILLGAPSLEMRGLWDLPSMPTLSSDNHWHLDMLDYRVARAAGGTRALLFWLRTEADRHGIWTTVNVRPMHRYKDGTIARLLREYGFQSSSLRDYRYMLRKPV